VSAEVTIRLPPPEKAPGFRDAVASTASMRSRDVADGWLAIAPAEGAGKLYPYITLERLADATTAISDDTWAPLLANPRQQPDDLRDRSTECPTP
jgi:hypothetical protein